jgi:predicted Rossmann fold nucleotide-binding protein DprA/Smf involved in DNA uptake
MSGDLLLATPFNPEAGFNVGNAMSRNRYVYCLADGVIIVSSTADKGGTWNGAPEGLKNAWVPLWVKPSTVPGSGNSELVRRGALWLPDDLPSLSILLSGSGSASSQPKKGSLPLASHAHERDEAPKADDSSTAPGNTEPCHAAIPAEPRQSVNADFYPLFMARMVDLSSAGPLTVEEIASRLELEKTQVNAWLKRALSEGKIEKLTKPGCG